MQQQRRNCEDDGFLTFDEVIDMKSSSFCQKLNSSVYKEVDQMGTSYSCFLVDNMVRKLLFFSLLEN